MKLGDALVMATDALTANPVRSLLTMLGIVIGVGCVVCMAAIGAGARARVIDQIRAFGANVLIVSPATKIKDGVRGADAPKGILTTGDSESDRRASLGGPFRAVRVREHPGGPWEPELGDHRQRDNAGSL